MKPEILLANLKLSVKYPKYKIKRQIKKTISRSYIGATSGLFLYCLKMFILDHDSHSLPVRKCVVQPILSPILRKQLLPE